MSVSTDRYLEQIQLIDLNRKEDRRTAVIILEDFYGTVMADVGINLLDLDNSMEYDSLAYQWNRITSAIETIDNFAVPDEFRGIVQKLKQMRDNVEHKIFYDPPKTVVEDLVTIAPKWESWIRSNCKDYHSTWVRLEPKEAMIKLIQTNLENITRQTCHRVGPKADEFAGLCKQARSVERSLQEEKENEVITRDLVLMLQYTYKLTMKLGELRSADLSGPQTNTE